MTCGKGTLREGDWSMKMLPMALLFVLGASIAHAADCSTREQKENAIMRFAVEHYRMSAFSMNLARDFAEPIGNDMFRVTFDGAYRAYICTGRIRVSDQCIITSANGDRLNSKRLRQKSIGCKRR